jgi:hypothetical protein
VRRTRLHCREQEEVEMALEGFSGHSSPCYASPRDVSSKLCPHQNARPAPSNRHQ